MHPEAETETFEKLLTACLQGICQLSDAQVGCLYRHYALLKRWNQVLNLSSIRDLEGTVVRHYCEALFLAAKLPSGPLSIADLGSGGGFPGVPLAVARPECAVTLIESHQRKAVFLKEATRGYRNVTVIPQRAERVEEKFDWLVSRAVAWEDVLALVPDLAPNVALLVGGKDCTEIGKAERVSWETPLPLPWGREQYLILGRFVSRGT